MEYIVLESGFTVSGSIVAVFDCKENIPVKSTVLVSMRDDARKWIIKNDGQPVMKNRKKHMKICSSSCPKPWITPVNLPQVKY